MKKLGILTVVAVMVASLFLFAACGDEGEPNTPAEEILSYEEVALAVDYNDGTWIQIADENAVIPSDVDNLIPTDEKYFYFEPYSTYGYKVRGFSSVTEGRPTDIVIPNTYNNKPVVMIDTGSFRGDTTITSVKMGSNMKFVYANAFRECTSLKTAVVGSNVSKIHHAAFRGCTSLTEVNIPARVTTLEGNLFSDCISLKKVDFVTKVCWQVENGEDDEGNPKFKTKTFKGVTDFNVCVFSNCTSLKNIAIPAKTTSIGSGCFRNSGLSGTVTLPSTLKFVGTLAFSNCSELTIIDGTKDANIATDAFQNVYSVE
jgi:hypothetical protein